MLLETDYLGMNFWSNNKSGPTRRKFVQSYSHQMPIKNLSLNKFFLLILILQQLTSCKYSRRETEPQPWEMILKIGASQLFLYKTNCATLTLSNKAATLKLNSFIDVLHLFWTKIELVNCQKEIFLNTFFAEQNSLVPPCFRIIVSITLRMEISKIIILGLFTHGV